MIDWHSHILPAVDDGSEDLNESLALLHSLSEQGVRAVVASSHFYANRESLESFLRRRQNAYDTLIDSLPSDAPRIHLGAEVKYYQGISRMTELRSLCIKGTRILLLEMPFCKWNEGVVKELLELSSMPKLTIMLAHIERYFSSQSKSVWQTLYENGILLQVNASVFLNFSSRGKVLKFLRQGGLLFVGSDCHNLTSRPPRIGEAHEILKRKLDEKQYSKLLEYWSQMLPQE
jgi:protein-tyrosine phosphatase